MKEKFSGKQRKKDTFIVEKNKSYNMVKAPIRRFYISVAGTR